MPFAATRMDLEIIILSEVSQRQISYAITYVWTLKGSTDELVYKTDSQAQKTNVRLPKGKGRRDKLGVWD